MSRPGWKQGAEVADVFEVLTASESEQKIAKQAATDKLAAATYDVREQFGAHLFCAKTKEEFHDRLALCKDDMIRTVNAHLMPVTGVMRRICKTMEREWKQRTADDSSNLGTPLDFNNATPDQQAYQSMILGPGPGNGDGDHTDHLHTGRSYYADNQQFNDSPATGGGTSMFGPGASTGSPGIPDAAFSGGDRSGEYLGIPGTPGFKGASRRQAAGQPPLPDIREFDDVRHRNVPESKGYVRRLVKDRWGQPSAEISWDDPETGFGGRNWAIHPLDQLEVIGRDDPALDLKGGYFGEDLGEQAAWKRRQHEKESRRRQADATGPEQNIQETFSPSDGPLVPEGNFAGYLDSVDQGAPSKVESADFRAARRHEAADDITDPDSKRRSLPDMWEWREDDKGKKYRHYFSDDGDKYGRPNNYGKEARRRTANEGGEEWDTDALQRDYNVEGFSAPFVVVRRKADGQRGSLQFERNPEGKRVYHTFVPHTAATHRVALDGTGGVPAATPAPAPAPGSGGNMTVGGGGNVNMSPPGFNLPDSGVGSPDVMDNGSGVQGGLPMTAAIIKRYAQWCVDNLARPSVRTLEYYAANRPDTEYFVLTSALQRHAAGGYGDPFANVSGAASPAMGGLGGPGKSKGKTNPPGVAVNTNAIKDTLDKMDPRQMQNVQSVRGAARTAAGKDYLQQADEAITNLLNEKAEEFQEGIQPLQQALQTIQYAQQVQQAQNPMNVMPPAGTVNVLPQGQAPQGPAPAGVDPSGQVDPAILQQLMGQGGMDPSMGGGAPQGDPSQQGGPPPAAADQGAVPPELAQQIQARRREAVHPADFRNRGRGTKGDFGGLHAEQGEDDYGHYYDLTRDNGRETSAFGEPQDEWGHLTGEPAQITPYKGKHRAEAHRRQAESSRYDNYLGPLTDEQKRNIDEMYEGKNLDQGDYNHSDHHAPSHRQSRRGGGYPKG